MLYEMLVGLPPFYHANQHVMMEKIVRGTLKFPNFISAKAKDVLQQLLHRDPSQRLGWGANGSAAVRDHPFFANHIDFNDLHDMKIEPPFKQELQQDVMVESDVDVVDFDRITVTHMPDQLPTPTSTSFESDMVARSSATMSDKKIDDMEAMNTSCGKSSSSWTGVIQTIEDSITGRTIRWYNYPQVVLVESRMQYEYAVYVTRKLAMAGYCVKFKNSITTRTDVILNYLLLVDRVSECRQTWLIALATVLAIGIAVPEIVLAL
jgi:serine/threonine protein kinase